MKKYKHDEWTQKYHDIFKVDIIGIYKDIRTPILCKCICGTYKEMKPLYVQQGRLCSQSCHNHFYDKVNKKLQVDFDIIEDFGNKYTLKCKKCYNEFSTLRRHNITCVNCVLIDKKLQSIKQDNFKRFIQNKFIIISEQNVKKKIQCLTCEHTFRTTVNDKPICLNCDRLNNNKILFEKLELTKYKFVDNINIDNLIIKKKYNFVCSCGNIFKNTIDKVLLANCPCKKCRIYKRYSAHESYKNKRTILYLVNFGEVVKIGVCLHKHKVDEVNIIRRFSRYGDKIPNNIIYYQVFDDGIEAYNMEQHILETFKNIRYNGIEGPIGGRSELFSTMYLDIIINYLNDKLMVDIANFTKGKSTVEDIQKKCQRDCYLSPEESVQYGLIDAIV